MNAQYIMNDIGAIPKGKGCIIFDFGLFYPYQLNSGEELQYSFKLGEEELPDMKLNHRYPNKAYYTITKKNGRKLHKCGYPYFFDLDEQGNPFTAILLITVKGKSASGETAEVNTMFIVSVQLSKEQPICGLSLRQNIEKGTFLFRSSEYCEDGGWRDLCWSNEQGTALTGEDFIPLIPDMDATEAFKNKCVVFATPLTPAPQKYEEIMVF